jgi:hypothetical protein
MKLKNYTTEVPAVRSIDNIEKLLVEFGCSNIMKEYGDLKPLPGKVCVSISFIIDIDGNRLPFKLPANVEKVAKWLSKQKPATSDKSIAEQANRIAWKQQHEILHLQLGQIEMNQIEKLEVFLPYLYNVSTNRTYYQQIKEGGFKALLT